MNQDLNLFNFEPFVLPQKKKNKIFMEEMKKAVIWHFQKNTEFKKMCKNRRFSPKKKYFLEDIPYFPASLFKNFSLRSVPERLIVKKLYSSSTSGKPSIIFLDQQTSKNQQIAVRKIISDFLGNTRRNFIIFDIEEVIKKTIQDELSSRGTAIRGMIPMARKMHFILDNKYEVNVEKLKYLTSELKKKDSICFFGFTWLLYSVYKTHNNKEIKKMFSKFKPKDKKILHIGGWKKLQEKMVSKSQFNKQIGQFLNVKESNVIDFYGMTEQLGVVYPDCEYGYKHVPIYSEVIIRDIKTLDPIENAKEGFIQLLSPIPRSYPGISILSDDIGMIKGADDCKCGRLGKYFTFERRSEKAELRGCGDVLQTKYGESIVI